MKITRTRCGFMPQNCWAVRTASGARPDAIRKASTCDLGAQGCGCRFRSALTGRDHYAPFSNNSPIRRALAEINLLMQRNANGRLAAPPGLGIRNVHDYGPPGTRGYTYVL